jgi:hypothetical protein
MIIAKINPTVNFTTQVGPFSSVTITCEYLATATAEYKPGDETNPFKVMFGHFVYNDEEDPTKRTGFKNDYYMTTVLTNEELSNWGTDDTQMVLAVVTKLDLSVVEYINVDFLVNFPS